VDADLADLSTGSGGGDTKKLSLRSPSSMSALAMAGVSASVSTASRPWRSSVLAPIDPPPPAVPKSGPPVEHALRISAVHGVRTDSRGHVRYVYTAQGGTKKTVDDRAASRIAAPAIMLGGERLEVVGGVGEEEEEEETEEEEEEVLLIILPFSPFYIERTI
jgi:hypothetical protein